MKKYIFLLSGMLLAGCAGQQSFFSAVSESGTSDLKACLMQEATNRIQDGSALAAPVRSTVKKMVAACLTSSADSNDRQSATVLAQDILVQMMKR